MWKNLNVELQLSKDKELNEIGSEIYKMMRSFEHRTMANELWISPSTLSQIFINSRRTTARIKFDKFRLTILIKIIMHLSYILTIIWPLVKY